MDIILRQSTSDAARQPITVTCSELCKARRQGRQLKLKWDWLKSKMTHMALDHSLQH